jgi:hypothetical protein
MFLGPVIRVYAARQRSHEYVVDIETGTFGGTVTEDAVEVSGAFGLGGAFGGAMCICVYVWWGERR